MENVKPKRRYRAPRRTLQAEATREAVLHAARMLFTERGWAATTITAIAEEAGISPETIYARFANKRSLLQSLVAAAMRGPESDTPFMEQAARQVVFAEADAVAMIDAFAQDITETLARVAPVLAVVRTAGETEPEMLELYGELHASRRRNLGRFVSELNRVGGLKPDLDAETATAHVWSLASPELFLLMTGVGGRDLRSYGTWLSDILKALLTEREP